MPEYVEVLRTAFVDLWVGAMMFLPQLVFAIVVFLLGLLVANVLNTAVVRIVRFIKLDEFLDKMEVKSIFTRAGIRLDMAEVFGWLVKWFVIFLALIAAADSLGWTEVTDFLTLVVTYMPNVLVAMIILLVGFLLGNFVQELIRGAVKVARITSATFLAAIAKWSIIVFSIMAALVQLGIAQALIQIIFTGFIAMVALAGGLAFGLGGREKASKILDHIYRDLTSKR